MASGNQGRLIHREMLLASADGDSRDTNKETDKQRSCLSSQLLVPRTVPRTSSIPELAGPGKRLDNRDKVFGYLRCLDIQSSDNRNCTALKEENVLSMFQVQMYPPLFLQDCFYLKTTGFCHWQTSFLEQISLRTTDFVKKHGKSGEIQDNPQKKQHFQSPEREHFLKF